MRGLLIKSVMMHNHVRSSSSRVRSLKMSNPDIYCWSFNNNNNNQVCSRNYHQSKTLCSFSSTSSNSSHHPDSLQPKYHGLKVQKQGEFKYVKKGDTINLNDLLFTRDRDYLVKYNDDRQVKAAHLAGKVIVLYFVPLLPDYSLWRSKSFLIDTYTYLLPDNNFEVVLVAFGTAEDNILSDSHTNSKKIFETIFSCMPWTAIPFLDTPSRERLASTFGIGWPSHCSSSVVIDSSGVVLQTDGCNLFERYGGLGYPFSDEWIQNLGIQDAAIAKKPSLKALLSSPKRDYLISNNGDKVLIDTLAEKVVALYFYEEDRTPTWVTTNIKKAYREFAQNKSCFEVVLIYMYGTNGTLDRTSKESFCNTFENMPWLAVPFKDPTCERLARFFGYPKRYKKVEVPPALVIFGPHGKFIEPWGADILCKFKLPAYPFTRERVAELYTEKLRELKLEMLWEQNTIFRRKNGRKVRFSQLVGKRIILFFEGTDEDDYRKETVVRFLSMLKESYVDMKGTSDEFEVIYVTSGEKESPYKMHIADLPCYLSRASELSPIDLSLYCCYCHLLLAPTFSDRSCDQCNTWVGGRYSSMLGFDQYGRVVRKSLELLFYDSNFPFCASMEEEALYELNCSFFWGDMDEFHRGLRINSYNKNENLPHICRSNISSSEDEENLGSFGGQLWW